MTLLVQIGPPGEAAWMTALALAALGLLTGTGLVVVAALLARRRLAREVREIVAALEELRTGEGRLAPLVHRASPLGLVADAVSRLGHDVRQRLDEAQAAGERWRALGDAAAQAAIVTTDADGDIQSFSAGAEELFGWQAAEVVSRPAAVLFESDAYRDLLPKLGRKSLRVRGVATRTRLLHRDGSPIEAALSVRLRTGEEGDSRGFVMIMQDVSEQVQLERRLTVAEERYRALVEGLGEGVLIVERGRIVDANAAAAAVLDRSQRELLGQALRDHVSTRDVIVVEERLAAIELGEAPGDELQCELVGPDGRPRATVRLLLRQREHEGRAAVLVLLQDRTPERRVEAELRRNEGRLDAVLEATSDGVLVVADAPEGGIVQICNRSFAELFDLRLYEVLGRREGELLDELRQRGETAAEVAAVIETARAIAAARRETVTVEGPPLRELLVTVAPLTDAAGRSLGRVVACRDLTEQRASERGLLARAEELREAKAELELVAEQLRTANDELRSRGEELDRLNRELKRLDEMKSNLLGNVSHELQTPLVSIRGYTEMTLKERLGPITEEQRYGLGLSLKNIDRLIAMIDNLVNFTRQEQEVGPLELSRFPLLPLIEEAGDMLRGLLDERDVELRVDVPRGETPIEADRDKILQVFVNLLSNAIKFNRQGGRIDLVVRPGQPGFLSVSLRDTGIGIPEQELPLVFDRHYRVRRNAESEQKGSGIGLTIVRDVLRKHGCTIRVESVEGEGTEFTFTLPQPEASDRSRPRAGGADPPAPHPGNGDDEAPQDPGREPRFRVIRDRRD